MHGVVWLVLSVMGGILLLLTVATDSSPDDLRSWISIDLADIYGRITNLHDPGAFRYSPPLAVVMSPLTLLPMPVLGAVWLALQLGCLWYVAGRWALALVLFPPVWIDLVYSNVGLLTAAAVVAGFRHSAAWSFLLLAKVTPGVAVVWYAVRREWRSLGIVLGVTVGALVAAELLLPGATREWIASLAYSAGLPQSPVGLPIPLVPRLAAAVLLVAWGGLTGRRWVVPIAVVMAQPVLWLYAFVPLIALVPLWRR